MENSLNKLLESLLTEAFGRPVAVQGYGDTRWRLYQPRNARNHRRTGDFFAKWNADQVPTICLFGKQKVYVPWRERIRN